MTVDFSALLSTPMDDIKRPPPLPAGNYLGRVTKYEFLESTEKKTPFVRYSVSVESAGSDIDPADLTDIDLSKKQLRSDFYLTPDALYRLTEFLEGLGIEKTGRTLAEAIPEAIGISVAFTVTQRMNTRDPKSPPFNEISDIGPA
jgi:hypothetical protein